MYPSLFYKALSSLDDLFRECKRLLNEGQNNDIVNNKNVTTLHIAVCLFSRLLSSNNRKKMSASMASSTNDRPCSEVDTAMRAQDAIESTISNTEEDCRLVSPLEVIRQESLNRHRRRTATMMRLHLLATCLSVVILVVITAFIVSREKSDSDTTSNPRKPTAALDPLMQYRFQKIRTTLMDYTEPSAFLRHDSPHSLARQWLYYRGGDLDVEDQDAVTQRYAVLVLLCATGGLPYKRYVGATVENQTKSECEFEGFDCDDDGNIITISLSDQRLSGRPPKELRLLTNLRTLDLSSNTLGGTFPNDILSELSSLGKCLNYLFSTFSLKCIISLTKSVT